MGRVIDSRCVATAAARYSFIIARDQTYRRPPAFRYHISANARRRHRLSSAIPAAAATAASASPSRAVFFFVSPLNVSGDVAAASRTAVVHESDPMPICLGLDLTSRGL